MTALRFTLVSDGSSDRVLLPILRWLLRQHSGRAFQSQWADLRGLRVPPRGLLEKIGRAIELYPCELLFVHRDAESEDHGAREREIQRHLENFAEQPAVCVVPVRMQEAWLLFDGAKLRQAADNPRGRTSLALPQLERLESVPDPKRLLHDLLRAASELRPGRLRRFDPAPRVHRLAELLDDFAPLRRLPAFARLESDVAQLLGERGWR